MARRATTELRLERRAKLVSQIPLPTDSSIVFVGSWGRLEVTDGSDNDFYVLVLDEGTSVGPDTMKLILAAHDRTQRRRETTPGKEEVFGTRVVLPHLLRRIGRDEDTNTILTQRMLLVLESRSTAACRVHERARAAIIDGYLDLPIKDRQPPRLFLNDVVKYWRTMCVDFAGKMRERKGQGWGLRNAKLRASRKILFASGLLPLLRCDELASTEITRFLVDQFAHPTTDRVADAFMEAGLGAVGADLFQRFEAFQSSLDDEDTRNELNAITSRAEADDSDCFQEMVEIGEEIERCLLELLFSDRFETVTKRYAIF